jgi:hypothetical protein
MWLRSPGLLLAATLCVSGLGVALLALAVVPLGLGGAGFGYKKLLGLLLGLESCGCGILLWFRLRAIS